MTTPDERCMVDTSDPNLRWLKTEYIARAGDGFERTGRTQLCPACRHASHLRFCLDVVNSFCVPL